MNLTSRVVINAAQKNSKLGCINANAVTLKFALTVSTSKAIAWLVRTKLSKPNLPDTTVTKEKNRTIANLMKG
jgi:hypothetical protein